MRAITLGTHVRDMVTGCEGVAIARAKYITGRVTILVRPYCKKYHSQGDAVWIDEPRLSRNDHGNQQAHDGALPTPPVCG